MNTIKKWANYLHQWKKRYYKINGAFFYYSKGEIWKTKVCAFLGLCTIEEEKDYLKLSTGSFIWYFKGDNRQETNQFKILIEQGISRGKDVLKNNNQNLELIPEKIDEEELNLFGSNGRSTLLEENSDNESISSISSSQINIDFKKVLKKLETKMKVNNSAFKQYIQEKNNEISVQEEIESGYEKIHNRLQKVNNYLEKNN